MNTETLNKAKEKIDNVLEYFNSLKLYTLKNKSELYQLIIDTRTFALNIRCTIKPDERIVGAFISETALINVLSIDQLEQLKELASHAYPFAGCLQTMKFMGNHVVVDESIDTEKLKGRLE